MILRKLNFLAAAMCLYLVTPAAQARLGETVTGFKSRASQAWKSKGITKKDDRSYHMFSLIQTDSIKQQTPGFGAAITLTVVDGKIVGQSMAVRFGDLEDQGKRMAALRTLDFAYEAIGKPAPKTKEAIDMEVIQFRNAIDQVLAGNAQHVTYPGYKYRITMSRTADGDLLVAVTPDFADRKAN